LFNKTKEICLLKAEFKEKLKVKYSLRKIEHYTTSISLRSYGELQMTVNVLGKQFGEISVSQHGLVGCCSV
jgi:hypothetical protein